MTGNYITTYPLDSLYKVTKKRNPIEKLIDTYFIHLEKTIVELSEDRSNEDLAKICHRIKGSSRNTGAKLLAEKFQDLENMLKMNIVSAPLTDWLTNLEPIIQNTKKEYEAYLVSLA